MKKKYRVFVREVHIQPVDIDAESEEEAMEKVRNGEGDVLEGELKYSHVMEPFFWSATELEEEPSPSKEVSEPDLFDSKETP